MAPPIMLASVLALLTSANSAAQPNLLVGPSALEFAAPDAASPPASQTVFVASSGDALSFQAKTGYWSIATGWLSVTPAAGATPSTLTLSVDTANLTTGVYLGYVEITSGTAKPTVLNVTLRVGGPAAPPPGTGASRLRSAFVLGRANHLNGGDEAHLVAEPRALAFRLAPGELTASAQTITIGSTSQILNYTASSDSSSWLAVGPQHASTSGSTSESNTVSVAVNLANLPAGTQTGFISVTAPGAAEALTIPVTVNTDAISPAAPGTNAALSVDKTSITLTGPLSGPPQTATIRVTSTAAGQSFGVGVAPAFSWLSVSPSSGTTPGMLTVTADPAVLSSAGQYSGTVQIYPQTGSDPTQFVQVIYNVTAGGGGGNTITAMPSSVSFTQAQGGAAPSSQTVLLSSTTPTSFSATISNASWLTVTPISGTTNATLTLTANAGTLPVGTYQGSITITGGASPVTVSVSLTVTSSASNAITASPSSVSFTQAQGGAAPSSQTVLLSSTTPTSFSAAISNASWLTVTPTSGTTNATLTLTANAGTLTAGTYQGSITITGGASPVSVSVSLTVTNSSANAITATPPSVSFTQTVGGAAPVAQTVLLNSTTPTNFTVTVSNASWLTVTPVSGTTNTTLTLTANAGTLTAGTYQGSITITGGASPVSIPVTLMVVGTGSTITANPPAIALPPLLLGQSGFSLGTIQLSALTPTSFVVSVPSSAPWLTVTPLTETTPATLTLSASAVGLAAGSYQTSLTITGGATAVSIPVMLTVSVAPNSITASPAMASFSQVLGGAAPAAQTVQLSSPSPTNFTASATSTWLTVTPTSGTTPASLTLTVNPAGMAAGTYQDTITISGGAAPVTIPVSLTLSNDTFVPTPASLSFKQTVGTTTPSSQTVQLTSSAPRNYIASATTNWLSVSPAIGITPATLTITANATGLAVGSYMGSITVNGAGAPLSIPVTLTVATAAGAVFNPASLAFSFATGGQTPAPQTVAVTSPASDFAFTATATASNGGTWLSVSVSPPTTTTPANLTVMVTPAGLAAGRYNGIITVTPTDTTIPAQNLPVTLTVNGGGSGSLVFVRSILNAASLLPGPIAPGEIITLTGLGLGPTVGAGPNLLASGAVDTLVAGTRVLFDGIPGPLLFVRADQINAIVPYTLNGRTGTNMQVEISGVRSDPIGLRVESTAPAIFSIDGSGRGQAAIVNQDGTINSASSPAARGDIIAIFGTGEGQTTPPGQDGRIVTTDLRTPIAPVSVKIGGVPAEVRYVGSAPGEVLGLFQLNVVVPAGLVSGPQLPVDILMGGVASQFGATMAVK